MKLTDIATINRWIELEQKINAPFGLNASVFDVDGVRISDIYQEMVESIYLWSTKPPELQMRNRRISPLIFR